MGALATDVPSEFWADAGMGDGVALGATGETRRGSNPLPPNGFLWGGGRIAGVRKEAELPPWETPPQKTTVPFAG